MFTVGQTLHLKVGAQGRKQEVRVVAAGGGHTTVQPEARVEDGMSYPERGKLKMYKDEDLAKELA